MDRDPAVASPWTVKRVIAEQHGVATEMPEEIRRAIDGAKAGEKEKRKKVWEDKLEAEGTASKRRKKGDEAGLSSWHALTLYAILTFGCQIQKRIHRPQRYLTLSQNLEALSSILSMIWTLSSRIVRRRLGSK